MLSGSTIMTISILAMHAHMLGDHVTARVHAQGLHKIVTLRGGTAILMQESSDILMECLR
jgi:hypothetical protein